MSMYEWASDLADERKAARKQRARNKRLAVLNAELLGALLDLLGDQPDIRSGKCIRCGRDYTGEIELEGSGGPSDDCPGYRARQVYERAKAGVL